MEHIIRNDFVPKRSPEVQAKLMLCLVKEVDLYLKILPGIEKIDIGT